MEFSYFENINKVTLIFVSVEGCFRKFSTAETQCVVRINIPTPKITGLMCTVKTPYEYEGNFCPAIHKYWLIMYVYRFQNVFLGCPTPRLHCFLSSHWPSFRFLSFTAFLIPSIQFFWLINKHKTLNFIATNTREFKT